MGLTGNGGGALTISWLTSYEGIGNAKASTYPEGNLGDRTKWVDLVGGTESQFSQVTTGFFTIPAHSWDKGVLLKTTWTDSKSRQSNFVLEVYLPMNKPEP